MEPSTDPIPPSVSGLEPADRTVSVLSRLFSLLSAAFLAAVGVVVAVAGLAGRAVTGGFHLSDWAAAVLMVAVGAYILVCGLDAGMSERLGLPEAGLVVIGSLLVIVAVG